MSSSCKSVAADGPCSTSASTAANATGGRSPRACSSRNRSSSSRTETKKSSSSSSSSSSGGDDKYVRLAGGFLNTGTYTLIQNDVILPDALGMQHEGSCVLTTTEGVVGTNGSRTTNNGVI